MHAIYSYMRAFNGNFTRTNWRVGWGLYPVHIVHVVSRAKLKSKRSREKRLLRRNSLTMKCLVLCAVVCLATGKPPSSGMRTEQ